MVALVETPLLHGDTSKKCEFVWRENGATLRCWKKKRCDQTSKTSKWSSAVTASQTPNNVAHKHTDWRRIERIVPYLTKIFWSDNLAEMSAFLHFAVLCYWKTICRFWSNAIFDLASISCRRISYGKD